MIGKIGRPGQGIRDALARAVEESPYYTAGDGSRRRKVPKVRGKRARALERRERLQVRLAEAARKARAERQRRARDGARRSA